MAFQSKNQIKSAFTMAEAILVMTILGIIATIMITTLKPAEFKEKALKTLYKKVLSEIDAATTQILINNSREGDMNQLFLDSSSGYFSFGSDWNKTQQLFKKYLSTTRQPYDSSIQMGSFSTSVQGSPTANSQTPPFHLKDGALLFLGTGEKYQVSPSASGTITVDGCEMSKSLLGIITVDINGEEEPNTPYKDQFNFPISSKGIEYEMMCQEGAAAEPAYDCELARQQSEVNLALTNPSACDIFGPSEAYCNSLGNGWFYDDPNTYKEAPAGTAWIEGCKNPCGYEMRGESCIPDI